MHKMHFPASLFKPLKGLFHSHTFNHPYPTKHLAIANVALKKWQINSANSHGLSSTYPTVVILYVTYTTT